MICRNCDGRGEIVYFDSFENQEISYACNECHFNGVAKNEHMDSVPLNPIEHALKFLNELKLKESIKNVVRKGERFSK